MDDPEIVAVVHRAGNDAVGSGAYASLVPGASGLKQEAVATEPMRQGLTGARPTRQAGGSCQRPISLPSVSLTAA